MQATSPFIPHQQEEDAPAVVDSVLLALMAIGRLMRQRVDGDQLDPGTFWLLKTISVRGPLRVTELAGCANLDTSTVSRHVAQLDRAGLVERTPDPDDGRAQRIQLTGPGSTQLQSAFARRRELLSRALVGWQSDDIALLDQLLGRFVNDIDTLNAELEQA
jgi:DNA-binding MarR family transcriptional regulator